MRYFLCHILKIKIIFRVIKRDYKERETKMELLVIRKMHRDS